MFLLGRIQNKIKKARREERFKEDFDAFNRMSEVENARFPLSWEGKRMIYEDTVQTSFDTHYIYHPAWAARVLAKTKPVFHTDISSKLDFSTIVSAFIPVKFYDYRPAHISLEDRKSVV